MDTGRDFLRQQVNNATALHKSLIEQLENHAKQAEDANFRQLCVKWLPKMHEHQQKLETYGRSLGADGSGGLKKTLGAVVLGKARDTVDAMRESDFLRAVEDTVMIRQLQDTFAAFAEAGDRIGEPQLSQLGKMPAADHEAMQKEFNKITREIFVDQIQGVTTG
jgi:hypothetical protein